jgi:hypothetical protein
MDPQAIANDIERIIRNELDDCERALKREDPHRALRELDDAVTKLRRLIPHIRHLKTGR